jgi:hypothetical protein
VHGLVALRLGEGGDVAVTALVREPVVHCSAPDPGNGDPVGDGEPPDSFRSRPPVDVPRRSADPAVAAPGPRRRRTVVPALRWRGRSTGTPFRRVPRWPTLNSDVPHPDDRRGTGGDGTSMPAFGPSILTDRRGARRPGSPHEGRVTSERGGPCHQ